MNFVICFLSKALDIEKIEYRSALSDSKNVCQLPPQKYELMIPPAHGIGTSNNAFLLKVQIGLPFNVFFISA